MLMGGSRVGHHLWHVHQLLPSLMDRYLDQLLHRLLHLSRCGEDLRNVDHFLLEGGTVGDRDSSWRSVDPSRDGNLMVVKVGGDKNHDQQSTTVFENYFNPGNLGFSDLNPEPTNLKVPP